MARTSNSKGHAPINLEIEALRPYLEGVAKKIAHDLFGPNGPQWGTSLTQLEDIALQTRAIFTEKFLSRILVEEYRNELRYRRNLIVYRFG